MIVLKSDEEIKLMIKAGHITAKVHEVLKKAIKPGISTLELDNIAKEEMLSNNVKPAFLNYNGFPAYICTSVNSQVVHGIPSKKVILKEGDIISIDVGLYYEGYCGDSAKTYPVGEVSDEAMRLIKVTRQSFYEGLQYLKEGYRLYDVSHAIQAYAERNGFSIVRDYVGHGVGTAMHEEPSIPNYGPSGRGPRLKAGMTLAIEPMVNEGTWEVEELSDGWTVVTKDGKLSSHYEHSTAVTKGEPILLTVL